MHKKNTGETGKTSDLPGNDEARQVQRHAV